MRSRLHVLLILLFAVSCGPARPETATVEGRVTYDGQPVEQGTITFHPEHGRPALGSLDREGRYSLTTLEPGDGALLGRHRVTISALRGVNARVVQEGDLYLPGIVDELHWIVPQTYAELSTTPLTREVKPGHNTLDFDLPRQP